MMVVTFLGSLMRRVPGGNDEQRPRRRCRASFRRNRPTRLTRAAQWLGVAAILWATLTPTGAAWARTVKFEAAEPLSDASDPAVERALKSALDSCVQRATAMGLAWIWLQDAAVLPNKVIVRMVASDEDPDEAADARGM
jgi:hypothetical protein